MKILLAIVFCFAFTSDPYKSLMFGLLVYIVKELAAAHSDSRKK